MGRWLAGILAAVIAGVVVAYLIGQFPPDDDNREPGGVVATNGTSPPPPDLPDEETDVVDYRIAPTQVTMLADWLDLDTGLLDATPDDRGNFELLWVCGTDDHEALRLENADEGAAWATFHVTADLGEVSIADLEGGAYSTNEHPDTGYTELFFEHKSNSPQSGTTYLIRTELGNYAAVRIAGYGAAEVGVCRDISLEYFSWSPS